MRQIKFRAWIRCGEWDEEGENQKYEMCYNLAFEDYEPINDLLAGVEHLMQFTGLLDSKNREIWEGDIIIGKRKEYDLQVDGWGRNLPHCPKCNPSKPPKDVSDIYTVEFDKGKFFLQRQPVSGKFEFNYNDTIEIIGNIYENGDLLK